jgi:ERCC4-type nuclease
MRLYVDCREAGLWQILSQAVKPPHLQILSRSLPLGDIILCTDDDVEHVLIERKTLTDLAASICDGRYKEQGFRLNACSVPNHNIVYLLEGDLRMYRAGHSRIDKNALFSAMTTLMFFKGFSVFRTLHVQESADWLIQLANKLHKELVTNKSTFFHRLAAPANAVGANEVEVPANAVGANEVDVPAALENAVGAQADAEDTQYAGVVFSRVKKNNITPQNIGEIMLATIPGVSAAAAAVIMAPFGTLSALVQALLQNRASLHDLDLMLPNKNGKRIRLSRPCLGNVVDYLLGLENKN